MSNSSGTVNHLRGFGILQRQANRPNAAEANVPWVRNQNDAKACDGETHLPEVLDDLVPRVVAALILHVLLEVFHVQLRVLVAAHLHNQAVGVMSRLNPSSFQSF